MTPQGILETALYARDLEAAERFYRSVMRLDLATRIPDTMLAFRCGHGMLLIFNPRMSNRRPVMGARVPVPPHGCEGQGHVCFRAFSHEIPLWIDRLQRANVRIEADFTWPKGGRSVYFRDPAGNSLELAEPRLWSFT